MSLELYHQMHRDKTLAGEQFAGGGPAPSALSGNAMDGYTDDFAQRQNDWFSKFYQGTEDWRNNLAPEQRAKWDEMDQFSINQNKKHFNNGKGLTLAMIASMAGAGAMGLGGSGATAGGLSGGGEAAFGALESLGTLGGTEGLGAAGGLGGAGTGSAIDMGFNAGAQGSLGGASGWNSIGIPGPASSSGVLTGIEAGAGGGSGISNFFKNLGTNVAKTPVSSLIGAGRTLAGLGGLYSSTQQNKDFSNLSDNLMSMYGPDSPYALQLQKDLQRRDAQAGRRSQYGPRAMELQAKLAEINSRNVPSLTNLFQQQGANRNNIVNSLLNMGKSTGAIDWLDTNLPAKLAELFGN